MKSMKNALAIAVLFLSFINRADCQKDSLPANINTPNNEKPTFIINADFRETLVKNSPITVYGGFLGLRFKDKNLYSLGYYTLSNSSKMKFKAQNQSQPILVNQDVSLWFISAGYTRTIYDGKFLKIDIPLEIGIGEGTSGLYDTDGQLIRTANSKIFPLQGGVSTIVKLTRWFGIHLQAGYREMLGKSVFQNQYSGLYYTYGVTLNFGTILKDLKLTK
jgi:hypothetical protein